MNYTDAMPLATSILLIVILFGFICVLFAIMGSYYLLLKRISAMFPAYYTSLNSPFLPAANVSILKTIKRDRFNYKLLASLLVGLPPGFPEDIALRRLATYVQVELLALIVLVGVSLGFAGALI